MKEAVLALLHEDLLTQAQIARRLGITRQYVSLIAIEAGVSARERQQVKNAARLVEHRKNLAAAKLARWWSHVDKNGPVLRPGLGPCWMWTATTNSAGYGHGSLNGKRVLMHRVSYAMHFGEPTKPCICHRCDNPRCVRPEHLFQGTYQENTRDAMRKGRMRHAQGVRGFVPLGCLNNSRKNAKATRPNSSKLRSE